MAQALKVDKLILNGIKKLSSRKKEEVLNYIEFLKIKEDRDFIEYVNMRTREAIESKKRGEGFSSLKERKFSITSGIEI